MLPAFRFLLFFSTGVLCYAAQADLPQVDQRRADSNPENYCIGGLQDRKIIPFDGEVRNPFKQTTRLGCEVEGGSPTFMPDLDPAIKDGKLA